MISSPYRTATPPDDPPVLRAIPEVYGEYSRWKHLQCLLLHGGCVVDAILFTSKEPIPDHLTLEDFIATRCAGVCEHCNRFFPMTAETLCRGVLASLLRYTWKVNKVSNGTYRDWSKAFHQLRETKKSKQAP